MAVLPLGMLWNFRVGAPLFVRNSVWTFTRIIV